MRCFHIFSIFPSQSCQDVILISGFDVLNLIGWITQSAAGWIRSATPRATKHRAQREVGQQHGRVGWPNDRKRHFVGAFRSQEGSPYVIIQSWWPWLASIETSTVTWGSSISKISSPEKLDRSPFSPFSPFDSRLKWKCRLSQANPSSQHSVRFQCFCRSKGFGETQDFDHDMCLRQGW